MPPKASKRKSGGEKALGLSSNPQDTLSLEPKRQKSNADTEDAGKVDEVSAENVFLATMRVAHTDDFIKGRRKQKQ